MANGVNFMNLLYLMTLPSASEQTNDIKVSQQNWLNLQRLRSSRWR